MKQKYEINLTKKRNLEMKTNFKILFQEPHSQIVEAMPTPAESPEYKVGSSEEGGL